MVILETQAWARRTFGECDLGDQRRTKRLVTVAQQVAARPDGSTPDQTEAWGDCKAAYRLFDQEDVTYAEIIRPHCQQTRLLGKPGDIKLLLGDTTEADFGGHRTISGLGPTGNGSGLGFFLHSALMLDAADGRVEGLAGQLMFQRKPKPKTKTKTTTKTKKADKNAQRRSPDRESACWGNLVDQIGPAPAGVKYVHVNDRAADDVEVFCRIRAQGHSCVIRASRLQRKILSTTRESLSVEAFLKQQECRQIIEKVVATKDGPDRTARLELRFGQLEMPLPTKLLTPWLKEHRPTTPLTLWIVELREPQPPPGVEALRWVLYTFEPVTTIAQAELIIGWYERRPTVEDYHKALKSGCGVERRYYRTGPRLARVTGLLSVVAVRLLQIKTAALETPDRRATEVAPAQWVKLVQLARKKAPDPEMTIHQFLRAVAGLGGHLGRKHDGPPGWITLWRGFEKLQLLARGADAIRKRCG